MVESMCIITKRVGDLKEVIRFDAACGCFGVAKGKD